MSTIAVSFIVLCGIGIMSAVLLGVASNVFAVKTDLKIAQIEELLPGANCGGCGSPSCFVCAQKMAVGDVEPNVCVLSPAEKVKQIGKVLGLDVEVKVRRIAAINCVGGMSAKKQYDYAGTRSCRVCALYGLGDSFCQWSCLGFGDCASVCSFGAMKIDGRGIPVIIPDKCTGCGMCASVCPKDLITLVPVNAVPYVACNTKDKGKFVVKNCPDGCITCKKCVNGCPESAINLVFGRIKIDYNKCTKCGLCIEECPRKIIKNFQETQKLAIEHK
ncbi:RnfABCDGE type electron transport complex subunit B [Candidatus Magnetoovum chiemensis]|nr:RnfABCDGE type electron transport complex subunit B [Candidatus Magnetoovum chiemensis]